MELNNVLDFSRRGSANISSLKRADENFLDIVGEANHAVLYQFDPISSRWNKMEYEGAIFAIRGKQMPIYSLLLLNRLGPENYKLDLGKVSKIKLQLPYIMIRWSNKELNAAPIIIGLWIPEDNDRDLMFDAINRCLSEIERKNEKPANSEDASRVSELLAKGLEDYRKKKLQGGNESISYTAQPQVKKSVSAPNESNSVVEKAVDAGAILHSSTVPSGLTSSREANAAANFSGVTSTDTNPKPLGTFQDGLACAPTAENKITAGRPELISPSDLTGTPLKILKSKSRIAQAQQTPARRVVTPEHVAAVLQSLSTNQSFLELVAKELSV